MTNVLVDAAKLLGVVVGFLGVATMIGPDMLGSGGNLLAQLASQTACITFVTSES